jgi:hypothetical protein
MTDTLQKPRAISRALQDLIEVAERALGKPATMKNLNEKLIAALLDEFNRHMALEIPQHECAFAVNLTLALQGFVQSIPGTMRSQRFQILAGVLLPMVRADLGTALDFERKVSE